MKSGQDYNKNHLMAKQKILRADIFWSRRDKEKNASKPKTIDQLRDKPKRNKKRK